MQQLWLFKLYMKKVGFCLVENKKVIVINKLKPTEQRIWALSKAFAKLNTSKIYVKPAIREMIELNKESI